MTTNDPRNQTGATEHMPPVAQQPSYTEEGPDVPEDPNRIRDDIETTRSELSANVDALADKVSPGRIVERQKNKVRGVVQDVKDSVFGREDDPYDEGMLQSAGHAVQDAGEAIQDTAQRVPHQIRSGTRGNPMLAGAIAFGVGFLAASVFPSSRAERDAVRTVADNRQVREVTEQVKSSAREMGDHLKEPAREAAEEVRHTAEDGIEDVKHAVQEGAAQVQDEAEFATDRVKDDAKHAAQNIQDENR